MSCDICQSKNSIHKNVTFTSDIFFPGFTWFLVLWNALQLWKKLHFGTYLVWAPMVQVHGIKKKSFYIINVMF